MGLPGGPAPYAAAQAAPRRSALGSADGDSCRPL